MTPASRRRPAARSSAGARGGAPAQERELRAQGKKTMRKLLDAAMVVFDRRGYHAARVDDIVKVARTSHGTFYLYFANKEDLFRALAADVAEEMTALADSHGPVGPDQSGFEELRGWVSRFSDLYVHYGPVIRAWTEAEDEAGDYGRLGTDVLTDFTRALSSRIAASTTPGVAPGVGAMALVAMLERLHYYLISRQIDIERDQMLDTIATMAHLGLFNGRKR